MTNETSLSFSDLEIGKVYHYEEWSRFHAEWLLKPVKLENKSIFGPAIALNSESVHLNNSEWGELSKNSFIRLTTEKERVQMEECLRQGRFVDEDELPKIQELFLI